MNTRSDGPYEAPAGTPAGERAHAAVVLSEQQYRLLGPEDFGGPGLYAVESIGPFVEVQAIGPLVTVHDSLIEPHLGIGHHPHRYHERLFYMLAGTLHHDDILNHIQGRMGPGEVGQLTEGRRGMVHSEWNHGDEPARAFILVYPADPLPERASFNLLRDTDAPRYEEADGVQTKELVGPRSPLRPTGDIDLFTDSSIQPGGRLHVTLDDGQGGLIAIIHPVPLPLRRGQSPAHDGYLRFDGQELHPGMSLLLPPAPRARHVSLAAGGAQPVRVMRVVFGPGYGLVRRAVPGAREA